MMPSRLLLILLLAAVAGMPSPVVAQEKPRVLVLTDIENEPDDAQSMVRFLSYAWFYYPEPGTFTTARPRTGVPVEMADADKAHAWLTVPTDRVMPPGMGTMHIILAVTDNGTPQLTRYQRVIVTVDP